MTQHLASLSLFSPLSYALFSSPLSSVTIDKLQTILSMLLTTAEGHSCFQTDRYACSNGWWADHSKSKLTVKHWGKWSVAVTTWVCLDGHTVLCSDQYNPIHFLSVHKHRVDKTLWLSAYRTVSPTGPQLRHPRTPCYIKFIHRAFSLSHIIQLWFHWCMKLMQYVKVYIYWYRRKTCGLTTHSNFVTSMRCFLYATRHTVSDHFHLETVPITVSKTWIQTARHSYVTCLSNQSR